MGIFCRRGGARRLHLSAAELAAGFLCGGSRCRTTSQAGLAPVLCVGLPLLYSWHLLSCSNDFGQSRPGGMENMLAYGARRVANSFLFPEPILGQPGARTPKN